MKYIFSTIFAICIGFVLFSTIRNYHGYCQDSGLKLDEGELIANSKSFAYALYQLRPKQDVSIVSEADFFDAFPDCCRLISEKDLRVEYTIPFFAKVKGDFRSWVGIEFLLDRSEGIRKLEYYVVDNCGKLSTYVN